MLANISSAPLRESIESISPFPSFPLGEKAQAQLAGYLALLQKWNGVYNLTAIRKPDEMRTLHLADCLAVAPHFPDTGRVLDVGTGGGLPGIVLAIVKPQLQVTLCDTVQKKCAFLLQVKGALGLANVAVKHARVESLRGEFDIITSRAFAELHLMVQLTQHLLSTDATNAGHKGYWLAMKAALQADELAALPADIHAEVLPLSVHGLDAQRCLVKLTHTKHLAA